MRILLDTHVLLWSTSSPEKLSETSRLLISDRSNEVWFSAVNLWEIAVKRSLNRPEFNFDPRIMREMVLERGFLELPVTGDHTLALESLAPLHRDPFDRMLLAQAVAEQMVLITADAQVLLYSSAVHAILRA